MTGRPLLYGLLLLLFLANVYIYSNREKGYDYIQQSAYRELYPNISKGIDNISLVKDSVLRLSLRGYDKFPKWAVYCNGQLMADSQSQPLRATLKQGVNRYAFVANDSTQLPIILILDNTRDTLTNNDRNSAAATIEIRYGNTPFVAQDSTALQKWRFDFLQAPDSDLNAVRQILTDSLSIITSEPTEEKIKKIGHYIYQSIRTHIGTPADSLSGYSTYQQFCLAKAGKAAIWCGNIADIFRLFASNAGIVCREVGLTGKIHEFNLGNHVLNECYLPETGQWATVDITQNILLLQDSNSGCLNTVDLAQMKKMQSTSHLVAYQSTDSGIIKANYTMPDQKYLWQENELLFPYAVSTQHLYSTINKVRRYVWPSPWLEIYSDIHQYNNGKFYLKLFLFYSWVVLSLLILLSIFIDRYRVDHS